MSVVAVSVAVPFVVPTRGLVVPALVLIKPGLATLRAEVPIARVVGNPNSIEAPETLIGRAIVVVTGDVPVLTFKSWDWHLFLLLVRRAPLEVGASGVL